MERSRTPKPECRYARFEDRKRCTTERPTRCAAAFCLKTHFPPPPATKPARRLRIYAPCTHRSQRRRPHWRAKAIIDGYPGVGAEFDGGAFRPDTSDIRHTTDTENYF